MTVMLVDANNLAMRSFHAAKGAMTAAGESTGALVLFVNSLAMHVRDERPDRLVLCWDGIGGSWMRAKLYPQYKANRKRAAQPKPELHHDTFSMIIEFCDAAGIAQWRRVGYEADDLIANATWDNPDEKVIILSSDKDLLQLLTPNVVQIRFSSHGAPTDRWDRQRVIDEMHCTPEQIPLLMALTGDASDGIPGMHRVGPKKALKMLQDADWDLGRAMEPHPDSREIVRISAALVDLSQVKIELPPVPVTNFTGPDSPRWQELLNLCSYYRLAVIHHRLLANGLWPQHAA